MKLLKDVVVRFCLSMTLVLIMWGLMKGLNYLGLAW